MALDREEHVDTRVRTNSTGSFRWPLGCVGQSGQSQGSAPLTSDGSLNSGGTFQPPSRRAWVVRCSVGVGVESKVKLVPHPGRTSASWVT